MAKQKSPRGAARQPVAGKAAKAPTNSAAALVEQLAEIARRHDLSEVVVEQAGIHVRVARHIAVAAPQVFAAPLATTPAPASSTLVAPVIAAPVAEHPGTVKSPMVGTAYLRPSPDAKAFVEVGATVKAGDKILLVEAMKTFNEIVAPRGGVVIALLVADGQPVEYGEALLIIE